MENDILSALKYLGYGSPLSEEVAFARALSGGSKSLEFKKLVHRLAEELKSLYQLKETVNMTNESNVPDLFLLELSSLLKELGCPYKFMTGHISSRLQTMEDQLLLLEYMTSKLMTIRMAPDNSHNENPGSDMEFAEKDSPSACSLPLDCTEPLANITPEILFSKTEANLKDTAENEGTELLRTPSYNKAPTEMEWKLPENTFMGICEEDKSRREPSVPSFDGIAQSFESADCLNNEMEAIQSKHRPKQEQLKMGPDVKLSDIPAASTSLLNIENTPSTSFEMYTQSEVNEVIIGASGGCGGGGGDRGIDCGDLGGDSGGDRGGNSGGHSGDSGDDCGDDGGGPSGASGGASGGDYGCDSGGRDDDSGDDRGGDNAAYGGDSGGGRDGDAGRGSDDGGRGGTSDSGWSGNDGGRGSRGQDGDSNGAIAGGGGVWSGGQVRGGYSQATEDQSRHQTSSASFGRNNPNSKTNEVPLASYGHTRGGYDQNRGGYERNRGGYAQNRGGYNQYRGGYDQDRGGNNQNRGGYERNRSGYAQNRGGYNQYRGGYDQDRGGYNQYRGGYDQDRGGNNQNRGGYERNRGGYAQNRGGYNQYRGGYDQDRGGYDQDRRGNNQNRGGYSQGHGSGYNQYSGDSMGSHQARGSRRPNRAHTTQSHQQSRVHKSQTHRGKTYPKENDNRARRGRPGYSQAGRR